MKVLLTLTYYLPHISGLTFYIANLAEGLTKEGYQILVLTSQHKKELSKKEVLNKIEVWRIPVWLKISKGFIMPRYCLAALKAVNKSDVVIVSLPQAEGLIVALYARLLGKKLLCIYHCDLVLSKSRLNTLISIFVNSANIFSLVLADKIITNTKDFANTSKILSKFKSKLSYIYPPIKKPASDYIFKKKLKSIIPHSYKFYIGVAARLAAEKGIEYLLEGIPLLEERLGKDFLILFAGPKNPIGEEEYLKKIQPLLEKYQKHILFLGTLPIGEMGSYYQLLDVLVLPSINSTESFGIVQVEAMLSGVPVVTTDLPGVRVPIQVTGMGETVPVKDSQKLAETIVEILQHKSKYIKNEETIKKEFSIQDSIEAYERMMSPDV